MYYPAFEEFKQYAKEGNVIPVYREILADLETPVTALAKLKEGPYVFLLESVEGGEKWGRYTFLGSEPHMIFRVEKNHVEIRKNGDVSRIRHEGNPLGVLKSLMEPYRPVHLKGLPRFCGGAVGFLGYDMIRYFEKLPGGAGDDREIDEAILLITDSLIIFDNVRHTVKILGCAFTSGREDRLEEVYEETLRKIDKLACLLEKPLDGIKTAQGTSASLDVRSNMTEDKFKAMVGRAKEYIVNGDIIQAVLSQRFQLDNQMDAVDLYRALRYVNPSPYLFFLKFNDLTLIGSSPEVMVRLEDGLVELRPIAGTRKRGRTEQEDRQLAHELLEDPKERAEHIMLVDLGRNDLGRIGRIGSVQVDQLMTVERYSHVMHLVSHIQAQLADGKDCFDVLKATFPAGTLTGAPKIRAMEIIDELEPSGRGPYGGAVGYISFTGNMDFCITIRTMILKEEKLYIQAGAGIVADSDPDLEYAETKNKAEGMMKAIRMVGSGFEIKENF